MMLKMNYKIYTKKLLKKKKNQKKNAIIQKTNTNKQYVYFKIIKKEIIFIFIRKTIKNNKHNKSFVVIMIIKFNIIFKYIIF